MLSDALVLGAIGFLIGGGVGLAIALIIVGLVHAQNIQ